MAGHHGGGTKKGSHHPHKGVHGHPKTHGHGKRTVHHAGHPVKHHRSGVHRTHKVVA